MVPAGAALVPREGGLESRTGDTSRTGRQADSILVAEFCSQLFSYRCSGTLHLFSSQDNILSLFPISLLLSVQLSSVSISTCANSFFFFFLDLCSPVASIEELGLKFSFFDVNILAYTVWDLVVQ